MKKKACLMLDSGAYSAWKKGIKINIDEYIKFVEDNREYIDVYINLDVIDNGQASFDNWKYMRSCGLNPVPVYHASTDVKYLIKYLKEVDYIGIGGIATWTRKQRLQSFDRLWSTYLVDFFGIPTHKVHAMGMTSLQLMLRYPWYSVDSTSWVLTGRFGSIFVPRYRNGEYIYDENSWKVCVSNRAADDSFQEGKHITTFSPMERDQILQYIHGKGYVLGKSEFRKESTSYKLKDREKWHGKEESDGQRTSKPNRGGYVKRGYAGERIVEIVIEEGISNDYKLRDEMNIIYFLDLEKFLPEWPWAFKRKTPKGFFV